jgi:hypothetical protein
MDTRQVRNVELHSFAQKIADHSELFSYAPTGQRDADGALHWCADFVTRSGARFSIQHAPGSTQAAKGKLSISGNLWHTYKGNDGKAIDLPHGLAVPSIKVGADRTAEAIARDVERRLLGDLEAAHGVMLARLADHNAYLAQQNGARAALLASGYFRERGVYNGEPGIDAVKPAGAEGYAHGERLIGDSVYFELRGLTAQQAVDVMAVLHGHTPSAPARETEIAVTHSEVCALLRSARQLVRDVAHDWPETELHTAPLTLCAQITDALGDSFDYETGE